MSSRRFVAVAFHWRCGLKMKLSRPLAMASRRMLDTTVRIELNFEEKRFSFTHSRGGSFGVSGGGVYGMFAVATTAEISPPPPNPPIYRSTSCVRTLNQFTMTERVREQLR